MEQKPLIQSCWSSLQVMADLTATISEKQIQFFKKLMNNELNMRLSLLSTKTCVIFCS